MNRDQGLKDLVQHILSIKWVASTNQGGRQRRISVLAVVGDGKGSVGFSVGKSKESVVGIHKAMAKAAKSMVRVPIRDGRTVYHDVVESYSSSTVCIRSAPQGYGVRGSNTVRLVMEAVGIKDAVVKTMGTNNPHNVFKALMKGLLSMRSLRHTSSCRDVSIKRVLLSA